MLQFASPTRLIAPFLSAALICCALHAPVLAASDGQALLGAALAADDHVSYSGTATSVVYEDEHASSTVARIEHKAPGQWRIWYLAPADAYGRMIVSNEKLTYQYESGHKRVYSYDWNAAAPGITEPADADIALVERNYVVEVGSEMSVAGRPATSLSLVSKHSGGLVQRIWVDKKTKLVLRRETYHANGTIASKSNFDNVRIGVGLPEELFALQVPSGMTLSPGPEYGKSTTDVPGLLRSVNFKFIDPKYLPDGFVLKKGSVNSHNGVDTVQLVYNDGLRTFSLFENTTGLLPSVEHSASSSIKVGENDGETADVAGETLVSWNAGGLNFTIVGNLAPNEIAKIGASVKN